MLRWKQPLRSVGLIASTALRQRQKQQHLIARQQFTTKNTTSTPATASNAQKLPKDASPEQVDAYLRNANAQMAKYHQAREQFRRGQLKSKNAHHGPSQNQGHVQMAVLVLFLVAFTAQPFLGKKLAQDEEFRKKWWPAWYDYTLKAPEKAWTRQELHEQMIAVEKQVRERAIQGDFTPEKLQEMQAQFDKAYKHRTPGQQVPEGWNKIHPGMEEGEKLNED